MTHTVFADRFPAEKQEWWWAYLVMVNPKREKTSERLMVDPVNITNLGTVRSTNQLVRNHIDLSKILRGNFYTKFFPCQLLVYTLLVLDRY